MQQAPPPPPAKPAHKISAKVLRLSRPGLPRHDITDDEAPPSSDYNKSLALTLPQSFGTVHVGEVFSCMASANSSSHMNQVPYEVTIAAYVQLPQGSTASLLDAKDPEATAVLQPDETAQRVLQYEPKEAGTHTLTLKISYKAADGDDSNAAGLPLTFLKHYPFDATPGLTVKTKLSEMVAGNRAPRSSSPVYTIETQIENVSDAAMTLESTSLLPADGWDAESFPEESGARVLSPRDVHQTAFIVKHSAELPTGKEPEAVGMGRFSLAWRREWGQKGFMTTGPLKPPL